MTKRVNISFRLLIVLVMIALAMAGCKSDTPAAQVTTPATQAATNAVVTVYARTPSEWNSVGIWAWKFGGNDAFAQWPGEAMGVTQDGWYAASVPAWIDRVIINGNGGTVQTADLPVSAGKDVWVIVRSPKHSEVYYEMPAAEVVETEPKDPFLEAAEQGDFETMKRLLPTIADRNMLRDWAYNDFTYAYAVDAIRAGDYETAIEFFGYCAYEENHHYATILEQLLAGDREAAIETILSMGFTMLDSDLDMTWSEIICMVTGVTKDESDLNYLLTDEYLTRRMWANQPSIKEDYLVFGDYSAWTAEGYIGPITNTADYIPVSDLKALYAQCGSNPNGKVLILRSQKDFPQGSTHYAVDMNVMDYLSYDLYPADLSEVEYIILVNYDYTHAGRYQQTITGGQNDVVDYFTFLRMKGQVQLKQLPGEKTIQQSQWVQGTGEPELYLGELGYQCSNMPETGVHIISAVEMVRQLNASKN